MGQVRPPPMAHTPPPELNTSRFESHLCHMSQTSLPATESVNHGPIWKTYKKWHEIDEIIKIERSEGQVSRSQSCQVCPIVSHEKHHPSIAQVPNMGPMSISCDFLICPKSFPIWSQVIPSRHISIIKSDGTRLPCCPIWSWDIPWSVPSGKSHLLSSSHVSMG